MKSKTVDGEVGVSVHLTPADLARRLQVHVGTVNRWRTITPPLGPPFIKFQSCVRYDLAAVIAWEKRNTKDTTES